MVHCSLKLHQYLLRGSYVVPHFLPVLSTVRLHFEYCVQFWGPHFERDFEVLECVQRRARLVKLGKGLEDKSNEEWLRELVVFSLEEAQGDSCCFLQLSERGCGKVKVGLFSQVIRDRTRGNDLKLCQRRIMLIIKKKLFTERVVRHWSKLSREVVKSQYMV